MAPGLLYAAVASLATAPFGGAWLDQLLTSTGVVRRAEMYSSSMRQSNALKASESSASTWSEPSRSRRTTATRRPYCCSPSLWLVQSGNGFLRPGCVRASCLRAPAIRSYRVMPLSRPRPSSRAAASSVGGRPDMDPCPLGRAAARSAHGRARPRRTGYQSPQRVIAGENPTRTSSSGGSWSRASMKAVRRALTSSTARSPRGDRL